MGSTGELRHRFVRTLLNVLRLRARAKRDPLAELVTRIGSLKRRHVAITLEIDGVLQQIPASDIEAKRTRQTSISRAIAQRNKQ